MFPLRPQLAVISDIIPPELIKAIIQAGPFAVGTLFGCIVTMWSNHVAGKERRERQVLEKEHEEQLLNQINIQQQRIDALHLKLEQQLPRPKQIEAPKGRK